MQHLNLSAKGSRQRHDKSRQQPRLSEGNPSLRFLVWGSRVSSKTRAPIVEHATLPSIRGCSSSVWEVGECVGWTRMQAAAGIIGLQQRSLTSPWTDGQTWSPKASIPRKPRYNSHPLSPSPTPSLYYPLGSLGLAKPAFAHGVYDFNRMEIRRESRVIRSYFPRNATELASAYSVPVFFFTCRSVTTLQQGN